MPLLLRRLPSPAGRTSRCSLDGQRAMMELRRAIHRSRTPEPYRASVWDESGVFAWTKGCGKMVIIFPQPFFMTYSDGKLPAPVSSRAGECAGMVAKILGSIETQSREISCHHGIATFRSEISPLRFASVEMTVAVSSRAEEHIGMGGKNLNLLNLLDTLNPGRRAAP